MHFISFVGFVCSFGVFFKLTRLFWFIMDFKRFREVKLFSQNPSYIGGYNVIIFRHKYIFIDFMKPLQLVGGVVNV